MSSFEVASEVTSAGKFQETIDGGRRLLRQILEKVSYVESRLDESQGKSSDLFRHIQHSLEEFDDDLGGAWVMCFKSFLIFLFSNFGCVLGWYWVGLGGNH